MIRSPNLSYLGLVTIQSGKVTGYEHPSDWEDVSRADLERVAECMPDGDFYAHRFDGTIRLRLCHKEA